MKHRIIVLLCVLAIAGAFVLAKHANTEAEQTAAAVTKQVQQNLATRKQLQSQLTTAQGQVDQLEIACQVGVRDYQLLTATQRLQASLPNCAVQNAAAMPN